MTRLEIYSLRWSCPFCGSAGFSAWLSWVIHGTRKLHACARPFRDVLSLAVGAAVAACFLTGLGYWIAVLLDWLVSA